MKRGQLSSETLFYILGAFVFVMFLFAGYKALDSLRSKDDQMTVIGFSSQFEADVESVSLHFGSSKYSEYDTPPLVDEICFLDLQNVRESDLKFKPILKDSFIDNTEKNVFLIGDSINSYYIEGVSIQKPPFYSCFRPESETIRIKFLGKGDGAYVFPPPNKEYCRTAEEENICIGLDLVFDTDYSNRCCESYHICC